MVIKKVSKYVFVFMTVCIITITGLVSNVSAGVGDTAGGTTTVTCTIDEAEAFPLSVIAQGNGYIKHKEQNIKKQTAHFMLKSDRYMVFELFPDKGEKVEKVILNNQDITKSIKDNRVKVTGAEKEQELKVIFSSSNVGNGKNPTTGDNANNSLYIILGSVSLLVLVVLALLKRKRGQDKRGE